MKAVVALRTLSIPGVFLSCTLLAQAQDGPSVALEPVESSEIVDEIDLNGTVSALRSSDLSVTVEGAVSAVRVDAGDRVEAGDILMSLDDEQAGFDLAIARAASTEARVQLDEARRLLEEARSLRAGSSIAATEVDARESEVSMAEAVLSRLSSEERRLRDALERHRIEAPYAGVVSRRATDLGEWITPGESLLTLVDTTELRLDFQVPQRLLGGLSDDAELLIATGGADTESVPATIASVVPVIDPVSRTFLLRARAPEALSLQPGMAVRATLRSGTGAEGLTVSRDAINRYPEGRETVWVAEASGDDRYEVSEKRVRVGAGFGARVEVISGLEGDEQVVVRGNESLREGATVTLAERSAN